MSERQDPRTVHIPVIVRTGETRLLTLGDGTLINGQREDGEPAENTAKAVARNLGLRRAKAIGPVFDADNVNHGYALSLPDGERVDHLKKIANHDIDEFLKSHEDSVVTLLVLSALEKFNSRR